MALAAVLVAALMPEWIGICVVFAQARVARDMEPAQFEVASVRSAKQQGFTTIEPLGTPLFRATNVSLKILIEMAYEVDDGQLLDMPSWLDSNLYDVSARASDNQLLTRETIKAPLQNLLEERFRLSAHTVLKNMAGYALVVAKGGPKLMPSSSGFQYANFLPSSFVAKGITLQTLSAMLAHPLGKPVNDRTGIVGNYDVDLHYAPVGDSESELPSIFGALKETLGLEVKSARVSVSMLKIDHVEKEPSAN